MSKKYLYVMHATCPGVCGWCAEQIEVGQSISPSPDGEFVPWLHEECAKARRTADEVAP
jgi:hypothetical protein